MVPPANGSQTGGGDALMSVEDTIVSQHKKKKKDKKNKKEKEHKHHHHHHHHDYRLRSNSPISHDSISNNSLIGGTAAGGGGSMSNGDIGDEQALSESELESKRAALLAQLNEQMEE